MNFTERQNKIIEIVKEHEPVSGDRIAGYLGLSRATLRSDLAVLTMIGILDARTKVGYFYTGHDVKPLVYDQLFDLPVKEIMITPILVEQSLSVYDAVTNLFMYDVGSLYVKNEADELIGVISRKDFLRFVIGNANAENTPVAMIMTRMPNIVTVTPDVSILEAGNLLMKRRVDSLPVVSKDNPLKVVGKLTKTRLMSHFIQSGNDSNNS